MKNKGILIRQCRVKNFRYMILIILLMLIIMTFKKTLNINYKKIEHNESTIVYPKENTYFSEYLCLSNPINVEVSFSYINAPNSTEFSTESTSQIENITNEKLTQDAKYEETESEILIETTTESIPDSEPQTEIATNDSLSLIDEAIQNFGVYLGTFEATWYCAVDMGYTSQPYGSSGRSLESGFSIASNSIPAGSYVRISGGGLDGIYRVDDCGAMADNVIDFYYWDRSCVPYDFLYDGRINVDVYLEDSTLN